MQLRTRKKTSVVPICCDKKKNIQWEHDGSKSASKIEVTVRSCCEKQFEKKKDFARGANILRLSRKGWFPYDRKRSRVADRRSQKVLRSSAIKWKHTSAIVCDLAIVIADDRRRSQTIAEDRTMLYLLRSYAIVCDQLRLCDHMETKVLRSAIETYPIVICIPTHDSTLLSNKAQIFFCSNRLFVVNVAGVEQSSVSNEEVARYECVHHRNSKEFKDRNKKANCWEKLVRNLIYLRRRRRSNSAA